MLEQEKKLGNSIGYDFSGVERLIYDDAKKAQVRQALLEIEEFERLLGYPSRPSTESLNKEINFDPNRMNDKWDEL